MKLFYTSQETITVSSLNLHKVYDKYRSEYFLILRSFPNIASNKNSLEQCKLELANGN
jgi:hypothetical protein